MKIYGIKAKEVLACAGSWAQVAEAAVETDDGGEVYVLVQIYAGLELTVSKQSLYSYLVENGEEPAVEFLEEYTKWSDMKDSAYAEVFKILRSVLKKLGKQ